MGMIHSELSPFLFFLALFIANFRKIALYKSLTFEP